MSANHQRDPDEWINLVVVTGVVIGLLMWWDFALAKEMR